MKCTLGLLSIIALLFAVALAEENHLANFRNKQQEPIAVANGNKLFLVLGKNYTDGPLDEEVIEDEDDDDDLNDILNISEDDEIEVQSFIPIQDDKLGTILIPADALNELSNDEVDDSDPQALSKARRVIRRRAGGNRRRQRPIRRRQRRPARRRPSRRRPSRSRPSRRRPSRRRPARRRRRPVRINRRNIRRRVMG